MPREPSDQELPGFHPASEHRPGSAPSGGTSSEGEAAPRPAPRRRAAPRRPSTPAAVKAPAAPAAPPPEARVPLEALPLDPRLAEVIRSQGIDQLYPPQAEAILPLLEGRSVVLSCPTSAGKSLVAYVALVTAALSGRRGIYIVPLRALASEKHRELKAFESLGLKVALTMGERDLSSRDLESVDILVATSEKTDSLLRHKSPWMETVGVVVADEVHLLRDPTRGPTLEVSLTRLRRRHRGLQVVALSATVRNSVELASWLDAVHVHSDFRPVPLRQGVYRSGAITFTDGGHREVAEYGEVVDSLVCDILKEGGQALVFVNSRKSSVTLATRLGKAVGALLSPEDRRDLTALSKELGGDHEEETDGLRALAAMVPHGTAFHNASLTNEERGKVEDAFRKGRLKCLVATTTLAMGLNLPARRVIVRDTTRYDDTVGMSVKLPALEVHQMLGRAGRPRYDPYGEALLLAKNEDEEEDHFGRYLTSPPEEVESQLGSATVLRTHLLALVASGEVSTERELHTFLASTFYGFIASGGSSKGTDRSSGPSGSSPLSSLPSLRRELESARAFLVRWGLLERDLPLRATAFGQLSSDLYLDPGGAVLMRRALSRARSTTSPFSYLAALALTPELLPLGVRAGADQDAVLSRYAQEERSLLLPPEEEEIEDLLPSFDGFLGCLKTALLLETWIDDRRKLFDITQAFGVGAGDLRTRVERAEWLLSSMALLASRERREVARALDTLSIRVRYGVRGELLELVSLRGIGRVRGRLLYEEGWHDLEALSHAEEPALARTLGSPALARSVLEQVRKRKGRAPGTPSSPSSGSGTVSAPASPGETGRANPPRAGAEAPPGTEPPSEGGSPARRWERLDD